MSDGKNGREQTLYEQKRYIDAQDKRLLERFEFEREYERKGFRVCMGVAEQGSFDAVNGSMFPMRYGLPPDAVSHVFLRMSRSGIRKLLKESRTFPGRVTIAQREYEIEAELRPDNGCRRKLERLCRALALCGMPTPPICAPYTDKFFGLYLTKTEDLKPGAIEELVIDFGQYQSAIVPDCIPVWNVEEVLLPPEIKAVGNLDRVDYRHLFSAKHGGNAFYVPADERELYGVDREREGLVFTAEKPYRENWNFYRLIQKEPLLLEEPIFVTRTERKGAAARTTGGVEDTVKRLGYQDRMSLKRITFPKDRNRQTMLLQFEKRTEDYLQEDILAYLVSAVQYRYPEFYCRGEFLLK